MKRALKGLFPKAGAALIAATTRLPASPLGLKRKRLLRHRKASSKQSTTSRRSTLFTTVFGSRPAWSWVTAAVSAFAVLSGVSVAN